MTSEDIKISIQNGREDKILGKLYRRVLPKAVRYISKNGGRKEDAEDYFQDAVAAIFEYSLDASKAKIENVEGFAMTMVRNRWINQAKKNTRFAYTNDDFDPSVNENITELILTEEKEGALKIAFQKIGDTCSTLLNMYYFQQLKMDKIAELMGFSNAKTVKAKSYQCKKKLAEIITDNKYLTDVLK